MSNPGTLSVEREVARNTTLEVNYIGTKSTHLLDRRNIAQPQVPASSLSFCQAQDPAAATTSTSTSPPAPRQAVYHIRISPGSTSTATSTAIPTTTRGTSSLSIAPNGRNLGLYLGQEHGRQVSRSRNRRHRRRATRASRTTMIRIWTTVLQTSTSIIGSWRATCTNCRSGAASWLAESAGPKTW